MTEELYDWLKREYIYSNIKKYHKYFKIWIANITESQIIGFSEQMARQKSHCMGYDRWDIISKINLNKYKDMQL